MEVLELHKLKRHADEAKQAVQLATSEQARTSLAAQTQTTDEGFVAFKVVLF